MSTGADSSPGPEPLGGHRHRAHDPQVASSQADELTTGGLDDLEGIDQLRRLAVEAARLGVWRADLDTGRLDADARTRELLGLPAQGTVTLREALARVHPADRAAMRQQLQRMGDRHATAERTVRVLTEQGARRWLLAAGSRTTTAATHAAEIGGVFVDVTTRAERLEHLAAAVEGADEATMTLDHAWRFTSLNPSAEMLVGRTDPELLGKVIWEEFPEVAGTALESGYRRAARTQQTVRFEFFHDVDARWYHVRVTPTAQGVTVAFHDITARREREADRERRLADERQARRSAEAASVDLAHAAALDDLTGLCSRRAVEDRLATLLHRRVAGGVVLFCGLDGLKLVNDGLGHATGDHVLVEQAQRLRRQCPPEATIARFGGDEFVVVLHDADLAAGAALAERVREALGAAIPVLGRRLTLTASIGVKPLGPSDTSATALRDADAALVAAKRAGRDRVVVFDDSLQLQATARLELEADLRAATDGAQLLLHHQPIFATRDLRPVGVEALVRWQHPRRGLLLPSEFIAVAEQTGAIVDLGAWVVDEAADATARLGAHGGCMWVNVSPPQLLESDLHALLARALERHRLPEGALGIELTERAIVTQPARVADQLTRIRALGVRIAVDDFGTGWSSMDLLRRYPVDVLKIDQRFIAELHEPGGRAIARAMVDLAHALGAEASAEGVERHNQLEALRELGCDQVAGYLLARPQTESDLAREGLPHPG